MRRPSVGNKVLRAVYRRTTSGLWRIPGSLFAWAHIPPASDPAPAVRPGDRLWLPIGLPWGPPSAADERHEALAQGNHRAPVRAHLWPPCGNQPRKVAQFLACDQTRDLPWAFLGRILGTPSTRA
jgi:hypothetical protein